MNEFDSVEEINQAASESVYISTKKIIEGGVSPDIKYHASPDCGGMKRHKQEEISKLEAEDMQYDPCGSCYQNK